MDEQERNGNQPNQEEMERLFAQWLKERGYDAPAAQQEKPAQPQDTVVTEAEAAPPEMHMEQPAAEQTWDEPQLQYAPPEGQPTALPEINEPEPYQKPAYAPAHTQEIFNQPKKKSAAPRILAAVAIVIAAVLVGVLLATYVLFPALNGGAEQQVLPSPSINQPVQQEQPQAAPNLGGTTPNIGKTDNPVPDIAEALKDAVVGVLARNVTYVSGQEPQIQDVSRGTGFIISQDGYIITNNHVVTVGNSYVVTMQDGTEFNASYVGADSSLDVAVLKLEEMGDYSLTVVPLGDSSTTRVGELVVAIGNPKGAGENLVGTVTVGYISAVEREILFNGSYQKFLQTDAAINPGNSGGPLVNSEGEVIGIVTLKSLVSTIDSYGNSVNTEGIGFAIPINSAINAVEQIIQYGDVKKPGIGIWFSEVTEADAALWNAPQGAMVQAFMNNSTAEAAGLQVNDIITSCDGQTIDSLNALATIIQSKEIGDAVRMHVWRNGTEFDIDVEIGDMNSMH